MVHLVHYFRLSASLHKAYEHVHNSNFQEDEYSIWGYSGGCHDLSSRNFTTCVQEVKTDWKGFTGDTGGVQKSTLVLTVEILIVFCVAGVIHAFELQDRHLGYIMTLVNFGWILVGYINNTFILQFLNCFRMLKNRFNKLSTQLSAVIVHEFEEEVLQTFLLNSDFLSRRLSQSTDEGRLEADLA
jgi:hypothetical protein